MALEIVAVTPETLERFTRAKRNLDAERAKVRKVTKSPPNSLLEAVREFDTASHLLAYELIRS